MSKYVCTPKATLDRETKIGKISNHTCFFFFKIRNNPVKAAKAAVACPEGKEKDSSQSWLQKSAGQGMHSLGIWK